MRRFRPYLIGLFLVLLGIARSNAQSVITYRIEPHPADKTYRVELDIPQVRDLTVRVQIPVWSPGEYFAWNYSLLITHLAATDSAQKPLKVYHPDQNTWEIAANGAKQVRLTYTVNGFNLVEADGVPKRGHIYGPSTYLYVEGRKAEPVELWIATPAGAKIWKLATSLDPKDVVGAKAGAMPAWRGFTAPSYDVLADAPMEMGDFAEEHFVAGGKPHTIVLYGDYSKVDRAKLLAACKRVAEIETHFFGDAPFHRYVFEFRCSADGGSGGLEHLGSTEIDIENGAVDAFVIAHEYFHLWNVKRIRPFVLGPFNYVDPPRTANLWWSEGVTSYYANLLRCRGGLLSEDAYLLGLARVISAGYNDPARLDESADRSSLHVWNLSGPEETRLDYYTKGELIGLCLDLKIREVTGGRRSLDNVIRALYAQCGRGDRPGFGEDDIKKTVNRVSGRNLSDFYDLVARSTDELPLDPCLAAVGISLVRQEPPTVLPDLGMSLEQDGSKRTRTVLSVEADGAAAKAGLKVGDRITAVNGITDYAGIGRLLFEASPGTQMRISTGNSAVDREFTVGTRLSYNWKVAADSSATPEQMRLRRQWLTGK